LQAPGSHTSGEPGRKLNWRKPSIARQYRVNERITSPKVRVIGDNGDQLGVIDIGRALQMARDAEVDLVEVAPNSDPPVCRLLDYGKLLYLSSKKERESKKGQKSTDQKEVRFRPNIGTHDLDSKTRKVREFIEDGSKVKLTVRFRGREAAHQQLGLSVLKRVADELKDEVRLERPPSMEGRALSMVLIPSLPKPEQKNEPKATRKETPEKEAPGREAQEKEAPEIKEQVEELADAKT
jgi:translation initiation factor IF-3